MLASTSNRAVSALILLALALPAFSQTTPRPKLPFTISKETTRITEPLLSDGTPDYIAALNAQASRGVTPENNAFVAFLERSVSPRQDAPPDDLARLLQRAGGKPAPTPHPLPLFRQYLIDKKTLDPAKASDKDAEFYNLTHQLWTPDQYPDIAAFLKDNQASLDQVVAAAERPQWWEPFLSRHGLVDDTAVLPLLGQWRYLGQVLSVRAMLRARTGDVAGAARDLLAVKRLATHLCNSAVHIENLTGSALNSQADAAFGTMAASGKLTETQCAAILQSLAALPPSTDPASASQLADRYQALQTMIFVATSRTEDVRSAHLERLAVFAGNEEQENEALWAYASIDAGQVDWDDALKLLNSEFDRLLALSKAPTIQDLRRQNEALRATLDQWRMIGQSRTALTSLRKQPDESRAAYTQRIAQAITGRLLSDTSLGKAIELYRSAAMQSQMARTLLAAANFHARTGHWPAALTDLVPNDLKEIPRDIYSANNTGTQPLLYQLTPNGPRIYSIGDSPGISRRDFGLGAPRPEPPPAAPPTAPPNGGLP